MTSPKMTPEQVKCANLVLEWANRMNERYGPYVCDKEGNELDWGQALAREVYGENWLGYMMTHKVIAPDQDVINRATDWEAGDVPDWVVYQDTPVEEYLEYSWDKDKLKEHTDE